MTYNSYEKHKKIKLAMHAKYIIADYLHFLGSHKLISANFSQAKSLKKMKEKYFDFLLCKRFRKHKRLLKCKMRFLCKIFFNKAL